MQHNTEQRVQHLEQVLTRVLDLTTVIPHKELFTQKETALLLHVSTRTLYDLFRAEINPLPFVTIGYKKMVRRKDIIKYLAEARSI